MASPPTDPSTLMYELPMDNWSLNSSTNDSNKSSVCSNDYCVSDEDYIAMIYEYIFPSPYEWILISLHLTVFVVGLIGNSLVCVSVYRNHSMRTVTNYFIVNLAVADFLVILVCLPPTVLWDVTKTWFFGSFTCKLVLYLQNVSVSVSVLTLSFISVDRWYAICKPLRFKSTAGRAKTSILIIWLVSGAIGIPEAVVLDTRRSQVPVDILYLTDCTHTWGETSTRIYQLIIILFLYVVPFTLMAYTFHRISKVLWNRNNIPGETTRQHPARVCNNNVAGGRTGGMRSTSTSGEGQIRSRRKASKMLMAVVVMFSLCYLPVHLINVLRYTVGLPQTPATTVASLISHWLCYANSALNPIIYNIMNGKFRKEFKNTFSCKCIKKANRHPGAAYLCKYTSTVTHCDKRIHELSNFS